MHHIYIAKCTALIAGCFHYFVFQHQTARLAAGGAHFCTPRGISGGQSGLGYWCYIFANG